MKTILFISFSKLDTDPRVNRHIRFLSEGYNVIAAGFSAPNIEGVKFIPLIREGKKNPLRGILSAWRVLSRHYDNYYWSRGYIRIARERLANLQADIILANDIYTLPLALALSYESKVIFDAHEYFPRQYEDRLRSRLFFQPLKKYLCSSYIPKTDSMLTVCDGIADQYEKDTGISPIVITNAPDYKNIEPDIKKETEKSIRLIYHGAAVRSRKIENIIEVMNYLDDRFELDMLLVPGHEKYIEKIKKMASRNEKIHFLPPVPMPQLVSFSSQYDIGLFLLEPTSFSYLHALPNKFFEFIQARLAIAIGPSPEMAKIVKKYDCGIVSDDFSPKSLAHDLMLLDHAKINYYKQQSNKIARSMSSEKNKKKLLELVERVLEQ